MNKSHQTGYVNTCVILTALLSYMPASVVAATIFAPTDGDVNFVIGDLLGAQLAIFDDSDQFYAGSSLGVQIGDIIGFAGPNGIGNHIATNTTTALSLILTDSDNFILGLNDGSGWISDSAVVSLGANAYSVSFGNGASLLMVDTQVISAVPLPAAAWLFSSGLLGLVGLARRKRAE